MVQAPALTTGGDMACPKAMTSVVQFPLEAYYEDCTPLPSRLALATYGSLLDALAKRNGRRPEDGTCLALWELVKLMSDMAEGTAPASFFLSSLDPGVGKTTALIVFVKELLASQDHGDVAILVCVSRREEIRRLVEEVGLNPTDFAAFTSDRETNSLSPTPPDQARILFTTHAMVVSRCRGIGFKDVRVFQYQGKVRTVRIWDEEMRIDEQIAITTDQLAALREPLRYLHPRLADQAEQLERNLMASGGRGSIIWPDVAHASQTPLSAAKTGLGPYQTNVLDALYALSGRVVMVRRTSNTSAVLTAIDSRDAIPDDLAPVVILDASGRVRETYKRWEKDRGGLVCLPSAAKEYSNLTIKVMNCAAGKTAWQKKGDELARDVADLINTKPDEDWLIVYYGTIRKGTIPDLIQGLAQADPERLHFLPWGRHQGTNDYRHIRNVIVTGLNTYNPTDYEVMARYYGGIADTEAVPDALLADMTNGEHRHHLLQALCRSAIRQCDGEAAQPCTAYIMAPKRSGITTLLPQTFPGCQIGTWQVAKTKATGKVHQALAYVAMFFADYPDEVLPFANLRAVLDSDRSNFRRTILQHTAFLAGLDQLGVQQVATGSAKSFARITRGFTPVDEPSDPWAF
jgi:hypothetical protein